MRHALPKLMICITITTLGALAADNSLGTWKRNMEKSHASVSSNPVKSVQMIREASEGGVKVTNTGVREDGTAAQWSYTAKYDGKEYPVTGNVPFDTISIKQADANTFTTVLKKVGGKYHTTGRAVISEDGKTYTLKSKGTNEDGKPFSQTIVYEKQ